MITYRRLPAPVIRDHWTREESRSHFAPGTEFHIGCIDMVANTGTYVDSPFHRYVDGPDLAHLPLESLADLPGLVVRATGRATRGIDASTLGRCGRPQEGRPAAHRLGCPLEDGRFRFFAVPVKVRAFGTFPVRAFAVLTDDAAPAAPGGGARR
jgi:kynurenine formamidase